eukprot:CAMPEP_0116026578 /NCGR_PEP_ID=MMETSP0321-20121206/13956_1 /TAXON_ID=163516 /ORGANISM="Leptocylindrus danicus var. danicus, Strain B650" /LENGTH=335 /DNA_ID=CAMNT_0003499447 /DNA_START=56 /DNA_END=1063 /DNA_ORIENTATION=+
MSDNPPTPEEAPKTEETPPIPYVDIQKQGAAESSETDDMDTATASYSCTSSITDIPFRSSTDEGTDGGTSDDVDVDQSMLSDTDDDDSERDLFRSRPAILDIRQWAEPDSDQFKVRGKNYIKDHKKIRAGESMFKLITVDLVECEHPIMSGLCSKEDERVQLALKRGDLPPFVVAINIIVPGPPFYHLVMYYKVDDMDAINGKAGTPFSQLANKFFFGESDKFRDETFKLIPKIVDGNFVVRKAVGSTPAIMGNKLKQYYVRTDRFFELILDVGSSPVASNVVKIAKGFAKTLIVDMAFVLEGKSEELLPEKVFGSCRLMNVRFKNLRKVESGPQ